MEIFLPTAPDPPAGISLASSTANTLHFTWNDLPCEMHYGNLERYRYHLQDATTKDNVASDTITMAGVGFAGLTPCREYELRVASVSSGVLGSYSNWFIAKTAAKGMW